MKTITKIIAGLSVAAAVVPSMASAAPWQNINARQAQLSQRIDQGVRTGALTRREAVNLRSEFRQIANLESRYRRGGLNVAERRDLDRRFNMLAAKVRFEKNDRQDRQDRRGHRW